ISVVDLRDVHCRRSKPTTRAGPHSGQPPTGAPSGTVGDQPAFTSSPGNAVVPSESEKCRAQARECEERADRAKDLMLKNAWLELARQFHEVADRLERYGL